MPRPRTDFREHRDWIERQIRSGVSHATICRTLLNNYGISVTIRTLQRRLRDWTIRTQFNAEDSQYVRERIVHAFHVLRLTDRETVAMLERDGVRVGEQRIAVIRKRMGLYKRVPLDQREESEQQIRAILRKELDDGYIEEYGRRMLYEYIRTRYNCVSRDRLYKVLIELNPEGVEQRKSRTRQHTGVPPINGVNYAWSMDAYCKLEYFGFQIYACIDVHSRYIVWIYIGVTGRTQLSVWAQYLETVRAGGVM